MRPLDHTVINTDESVYFFPVLHFYKTIHLHNSHYVYKNVHTLNTMIQANTKIQPGERGIMAWSAAGCILWLWRLQELIRIVNHV